MVGKNRMEDKLLGQAKIIDEKIERESTRRKELCLGSQFIQGK